MTIREQTEDIERTILHAKACLSARSRGRLTTGKRRGDTDVLSAGQRQDHSFKVIQAAQTQNTGLPRAERRPLQDASYPCA